MADRVSTTNARSRSVSLAVLEEQIPRCQHCPELREYCTDIALTKVRRFVDWEYWGRPVASFGDHHARIVILGLAPAAHGANRTGRMFTGDRSGDFLYAALHRAGLANQAISESRQDGLALKGVYITAALRCAPPGNKPTPGQLENCAPYLRQELELLQPRVIICLGSIAWKAALGVLRFLGLDMPRPLPKFGHGVEAPIGSITLLGCYHVSQQNTFTGRLTTKMIDEVLHSAVTMARDGAELAHIARSAPTASKLAR